jgi:hypothetical protein
MNIVAIILGVIVILFMYVLYNNYIRTNNLIGTTNLLKETPIIDVNNLQSNASVRYAFGIWVYVNSWNNTNQKNILSRGGDFDLFLDKTSPTLILQLKLQDTKTPTILLTLTNNFPIQKWTYVILSVDNQIVDFYMDGKLVLSKQLSSMPVVSKNAITLGSGNPDITVTALNRYTEPMDPATAWAKYLSGNGISNTGSAYNVNVSVLKDSVVQSTYSLY